MTRDNAVLQQFGITEREIDQAISLVNIPEVDDADLYFEHSIADSVSLEEGIVKKASKHVSQGVGVRATAGEKTGYAYTDEITLEQLKIAAKTAKYIARSPGNGTAIATSGRTPTPRSLYPVTTPATEIATKEKVDLLEKIDAIARGYDPRIKNVMASFATENKMLMVASSEGWVVGDVQPLSRLQVTCIAADNNVRQMGSFGGGGRGEFSFFFDENRFEQYAKEAARQSIVNLNAVPAPAGMMDVVLGPGWPGILLHEAVGHGLEADFNRKKTSAFSDRIGKKVASPLCTVVDDGTIPWRRGSLNMDDEGTPTGRTVLIEDGILRGYITDRLNARLMGIPLTGNGRRESFMSMPLPRMTNTFMLPGESNPDDIIRSVKHGLYAVSFGGGQVDITNGMFVFSASEAYLIEDGKVTKPVKDATLIGNGPEVLTRVSMVGNDLRLDDGIGTCGKDGQSVPVGVGSPTIKVDGMTIGGTNQA